MLREERRQADERYRALQGKYNREVPQLHSQINDLVQRLEALEKPAPQATDEKPVASDDEITDYGADLIGLITRIARGEAEKIANALTPKFEEVSTSLGQLQSRAASQATRTIHDELDDAVQDWREINRSPGFVAWLQELDDMSGLPRQDLLMGAFNKGDAKRVIRFFKTYLAERQPPTQPAPPPAPAPQPAPPSRPTLADLAGGVSGGSDGTPVQTQPAPEEVITRAGISKFYADVRAGLYKNDPEGQRNIEKRIAAASAGGRIL